MKFEEFLMVKCMEQTHALDDDLPDVYEAWIVEQDVSDIIKWATWQEGPIRRVKYDVDLCSNS